jgi:hypothetical protein
MAANIQMIANGDPGSGARRTDGLRIMVDTICSRLWDSRPRTERRRRPVVKSA